MKLSDRVVGGARISGRGLAPSGVRWLGGTMLLIGAAVMAATGADAAEPDPDGADAGAVAVEHWAYDPFGSGLFPRASASDASRIAAADVARIGQGDTGLNASSTLPDASRDIPENTRFGAGSLDDLWGREAGAGTTGINVAETEPMFEGGQPVPLPAETTVAGIEPAANGGGYSGSTRLTSRVSEFDGNAGELFSAYMSPRPKSVGKAGAQRVMTRSGTGGGAAMVRPVLSVAKTEAGDVSALSVPPNMPSRVVDGASLTSRVTRVERLSITSGMLRNVY